jgi:hypothetical protein
VKAVIDPVLVELPRLEEVSIPTVTALAHKHSTTGGTTLTKQQAEVVLRAMLARQAEL